MNFLSDIYNQTLAKNDEALRFWENYLQNLKSLDFSVYADKLKVPALVPLGSKILFRGEVKHTNEVMVALGADYFVKCSVAQAEVLRQHRIKDAESKVEALQKERDYIINRFSFNAENVFKEEGQQEIFEEFTEDEDLKWREQHKANMKQYKQSSKKEAQPKENINDEDLWYRLEELELKEELEGEMDDVPDKQKRILNSNRYKRKSEPQESYTKNDDTFTHQEKQTVTKEENVKTNESHTPKNTEVTKLTETVAPSNDSKLELLQQVLDKQNELKEKLVDLKNKESAPSITEKDLMKRLDEMDQLDELEDEMDRLDDILQNEDVEESDEAQEETLKVPAVSIKRSVSFADEDESETLEIEFSHSDINPGNTPYDKEKGITKPSDVYAAYSNLFTETTSILKKSKYDSEMAPSGPRVEKRTKVVDFQEAEDNRKMNKTISVNDVVEKVDENDNTYDATEKRPMSLFKKRRQQNRR